MRVAIVGASGYSGAELTRLLAVHQKVSELEIFSNSLAGKMFDEHYPNMAGEVELRYQKVPDGITLRRYDVVFLATPAGAAMSLVRDIGLDGPSIIDLSADFRYRDYGLYKFWYGKDHLFQNEGNKFIYGLTELNRDALRGARLVSNPGCYPTSILLALVPLLRGEAIIEKEVISDAKSGVSGAGRKLQEEYLFYNCNENIVPYRPVMHSHIGEMEHQVYNLTGQDIRLSFTPHLVPLNRGILSTIYCRLRKGKDVEGVEERYSRAYKEESFVQVLPSGWIPNIRDVVGSNSCRIGYIYDERAGILKIFSSLDNLLKGAAGQAVQNMNVMFGFSEMEGLPRQALG